MSPRVYVSFPISEDMGTLNSVVAKINQSKATADFWDRGTYYNKKMSDYDAVVIVMPKNGFSVHGSGIPNGVKLEIASAIRSNTKLFLAYRASNGMNIYDAQVQVNNNNILHFSGVGGTSHVFHEFIETRQKSEEMKQTSGTTVQKPVWEESTVKKIENRVEVLQYDERLLLF